LFSRLAFNDFFVSICVFYIFGLRPKGINIIFYFKHFDLIVVNL
jgi:hypothetical protein